MYIRKRYSFIELLKWTRAETIGFLLYASVVTYLFEGLDLYYLHIPWTPIALVGTAVAFLVGFQHNAAYGRTWEARKIWGGIVNSSRTWGMKVQDMVRPLEASTDSNDGERKHIKDLHRTLVGRHIAWLTALRHQLREPRQWESSNESLTGKEWYKSIHIPERKSTFQSDLTSHLPLNEFDYVMSKTNKATTILYLQSRHLRKLKEQGLIWEFAFLSLEDLLEEFVTLQGKSERIKNFPYPRQFATLSHWLLWMFLVLLPFGIVPQFHYTGQQLESFVPWAAENFAWGAIPFCGILSWIFHTMERIGRVGENPFECSPNDVPISSIARTIEIDLLQQLNEDSSKIPEPFPILNNVQM